MKVFHSAGSVLLLIFLSGIALPACKEQGTVQVHSLSFKGVKAFDPGRLKAVLATRESSKLPWGAKRYFDRAKFEADLKRIVAFYADRGYPEARVTSFDVKLNAQQDKVDLVVDVSEGEPIRVTSITFTGFETVPRRHLAAVKSRVPIKVGEPRDRQLVLTTREMAANELKDHGYPYAQVTVEEQSAGPHETNLTFVAQPGTLAHFGSVEIQGEKSVDENIIRRALLYKPGELFRRSQVQETQRKLYGMELFQFANVEVLNPEEQSPEVKTRVTVAEGKHRQVNFGVGYGTEEKARADAQFHYLNFLGGARTAGAHVRYSSLDRGVRLDFNQPYLFAPHFSLGAEAQQWYTYEPAYNLLTRGAHVTLTHRANQQTSWSATLLHEFDRNSVSDVALKDPTLRSNLIALGLDPVTGKQEGTVSSVAFDYQRNTTANLLNATNGYVLSGHVEQAGRFLPGTFKYFALSSEGRHYFTLAKRFVIANKVQIASIDATGDRLTNVPFSKRYFLGGATSVRGWGRFEISPLIQGLPIGGFSLLTASSELRMPLYGNFGGVLFVDAGNVWSTAWEYHLNDLRYAVGPGLRYMTPIGPIRFDVGFQVNPIQGLIINGDPEKRHWRIHFSIGQAF